MGISNSLLLTSLKKGQDLMQSKNAKLQLHSLINKQISVSVAQKNSLYLISNSIAVSTVPMEATLTHKVTFVYTEIYFILSILSIL